MIKWRWRIAQFAEKNWWKIYLRNKPVDTYLMKKKAYWHKVLAQIDVTIAPDTYVLDAGCGPAGIFIIANTATDALDPLIDYYEKEIEHFKKKDWLGVTFFNQSLENIDTPHLYDQVFCLNAINHVDDIQLATQQLVAKLKQGGQLIISSDAHRSNLLKKIFQLLPGDILHPHQYDKQDYERIWTDNGLVIERSFCLRQEDIFDYWVWVCRRP